MNFLSLPTAENHLKFSFPHSHLRSSPSKHSNPTVRDRFSVIVHLRYARRPWYVVGACPTCNERLLEVFAQGVRNVCLRIRAGAYLLAYNDTLHNWTPYMGFLALNEFRLSKRENHHLESESFSK